MLPAAMRERDLSFVLVELAGFTSLVDPVDDADAVELIPRFHELVRANLVGEARIARLVGGVTMIVAQSIPSAIMTVFGLWTAVRGLRPLRSLRGAIHAGNAVERDHEVTGDDLVLAARIADFARSGEILCTSPVAIAAKHLQLANVVEAGEARFAHVARPIELFRIKSKSRPETDSM
jgi:class 3 adenylate cyclase